MYPAGPGTNCLLLNENMVIAKNKLVLVRCVFMYQLLCEWQ
jgi:hypothetical protein